MARQYAIGVLRGGAFVAEAGTRQYAASTAFLNDTTSAGGALNLKSLTAALSFAGAYAARTARALTGVASFAGAMPKKLFRSLAATCSPAAAHVKRAIRAASGALGFAGAQAKKVFYPLAAALSFVGAQVRQKFGSGTLYLQALLGTLSFTGVRARGRVVVLTAALSMRTFHVLGAPHAYVTDWTLRLAARGSSWAPTQRLAQWYIRRQQPPV